MAAGRATLDFFAAQASARRRTALLVVLFATAWLATIAVVYLALAVVLSMAVTPTAPIDLRSPPLLLAVAGAVTAVTLAGAAWHGVRLAAGGGEAVARMLGGIRVDRSTERPDWKRLVNVVEEMAIAAGVPVPDVWVLDDEPGINAFAAGFTPDRSVVTVTRGALEALTRDELQGVVAHELSHVVNADTRLNLQLIALVGGLTALALVGRTLLRGTGRVRAGSRGKGAGGAIVAAGLVLWAAGSAGAFFARLIRLAVSREREYLADAAAVQFTRNPGGLTGALGKIAAQGSRLLAPQAPEAAHLFFANGLASRLLSTHPPVEERIRRIAPGAAWAVARAARAVASGSAAAAPSLASGLAAAQPGPGADADAPDLRGAADAAASEGAATSPHGHAAVLLAALPAELVRASRDPAGARAVVCALLGGAEADAAPLTVPRPGAPAAELAARAEARRLAVAASPLDRGARMALLELALPALDGLSPEQARALVADLATLAGADGRTTVFEWAVQRIVRRRLARPLGEARRAPGAGARRVEDVALECHEVLSILAWLGHRDPAGAQAALDAGVAVLGARPGWRPLPREKVGAARLESALERLDQASPAVKARLLAACEACARADGRILPAEAEVLRAVAASLGAPAPLGGADSAAWTAAAGVA